MADAQAIQNMANAVQQMATSIQDLVTALDQQLPANAPDPDFAATPGTAKKDKVIDYSTRYGAGIYAEGSKSLYDADDAKFDLDNSKALSFVRDVKARAKKMGWDDANQGVTTYQVDGSPKDLIEHYGLIDLDDIKSQSEPFYSSVGVNHNKRAAQNNAQFAEMLKHSLTQKARDQVALYEKEYELDDGTGEKVIVAPMMYKIIMRLTTLDTKTTNVSLRDAIRELPTVAAVVKGNIDKIHEHFNTSYTQLRSRGEDLPDKEELLFRAYAQVPDAIFRNYMARKKEDFMENINDMKDKDYEYIMRKAKEKYNELTKDPKRAWGAPDATESEVIALKAELTQVRDKNIQLSRQLRNKLDKPKDEASDSEGASPTAPTVKTKNTKNRSDQRRQKADEAWKKIPPKPNEPKTTQKNKKTWYWCPHHLAWCIHKEAECKLGLKLKEEKTKLANQATVESQQTPYEAMLAHLADVAKIGE